MLLHHDTTVFAAKPPTGTMHMVANISVTGANTRLAHLSIAEDAWQ